MKTLYTLLFLCFASTLFAQSWNKAAAFPGATRDGAVEFAIGDNVYFGGGESKDFWEYDTKADKWTKKADIPGSTMDREFGAGFSIGTKGYVGLGVDNGKVLADLWEYDPASNTWTRKADYPAGGRDAIMTFVIGDKAYIGGGTDDKYIYSEFYEFDPSANTWTSLGMLPMDAVAFPTSFVVGSKGYVTCGDLGTGNGQLTSFYCYEPSTNHWSTLSDFPGAERQCAVSFTINGKGYVGLGQANYDTVFSDFFSYDPSTDKWQDVSASFPVTPGRAWACATAVNGNAYIGGGWDLASHFYKDWWKFDATPASLASNHSDQNRLSIYPNPVTSSFTLDSSDLDHTADIEVTTLLGEPGMKLARSSDGKYDASALPTGAYIIKVKSESGTRSIKLLKQ